MRITAEEWRENPGTMWVLMCAYTICQFILVIAFVAGVVVFLFMVDYQKPPKNPNYDVKRQLKNMCNEYCSNQTDTSQIPPKEQADKVEDITPKRLLNTRVWRTVKNNTIA